MDWSNLIYFVYSSPFFAVLLDWGFAYFKHRTPYIKRIYAWFKNSSYKVQMRGVKKYSINQINIKDFKRELFNNRYSHLKIISEKNNSIMVLIDAMQAPYEILITLDDNECIIVNVALMGSINFRFRDENSNIKYINVLNSFFDIIEQIINQKEIYSFFTFQADVKNEFNKRPFITEIVKDECEDTVLDIDRSTNYIKINSKHKDNLYYCLKKNIYKVL